MAKRPILELLNGVTRFGRLTVTGEGDPLIGAGHPARRARCVCDCGNIRDAQPGKLKQGKHQSCGCLAAEAARDLFTTHGLHGTPEYRSWNAMRQRCLNPSHTSYPSYGGRGITICAAWLGEGGVEQFVSDLGPRPPGTTLDRVNPDGNYEPGNVRWATVKSQQANRRNSLNISFDGLTMNPQEWAEHLGMSRNAVSERLRKGWTVERAIATPVGRRGGRA